MNNKTGWIYTVHKYSPSCQRLGALRAAHAWEPLAIRRGTNMIGLSFKLF